MTRADFYILTDNKSPERFVCDIATKIWKLGHTIYIHTLSKEEAAKIDDLLWTYQDISFLPHCLVGSSTAPVTIGWEDTDDYNQVLINISQKTPVFANSFSRIIELVAGEPSIKQQARARYKEYRELGFELYSHDIGLQGDARS